MLAGNTGETEEKREASKERLLKYHDRHTGGIPGLLPLVVDLPVRFTDAIDRKAKEQGVFKHTRGVLRGWDLPEEEDIRVRGLAEWEIVLQRRPTKLHIEVPTGTKLMPKIGGRSMYTLTTQARPWSLGDAGTMKLKRYGFPIVPDFGGTAHAYCGSTLPAAIGDCLSWTSKPQRDSMLRAYIIKSRVKRAEDMLIVQAYSPHLFRQGMLPGPQLLLDVLTKKTKTTEEVKKAWKVIEKKADGGERSADRPADHADLAVPHLHGRQQWRGGLEADLFLRSPS